MIPNHVMNLHGLALLALGMVWIQNVDCIW